MPQILCGMHSRPCLLKCNRNQSSDNLKIGLYVTMFGVVYLCICTNTYGDQSDIIVLLLFKLRLWL